MPSERMKVKLHAALHYIDIFQMLGGKAMLMNGMSIPNGVDHSKVQVVGANLHMDGLLQVPETGIHLLIRTFALNPTRRVDGSFVMGVTKEWITKVSPYLSMETFCMINIHQLNMRILGIWSLRRKHGSLEVGMQLGSVSTVLLLIMDARSSTQCDGI